MGIGSRGGLAAAMRHAFASVAIFAQVLLLFSPLIEVREGPEGSRAIAAGLTTPDAPTLGAQHGQAQPHNSTTCPACIAQSLHAQLTDSVRLPITMVAARTPLDIRNSVLPQHDPPSTHHSRAPPVLS